MQVKFQTALVTGSSRGIGRQIAVKLAQEGVKKIAIHYRTGRSDSEKTLSLIEEAGASGVLVQGDVADAIAAEKMVNEAAQKLGGCDIFIQSVVPPLGEIHENAMSTDVPLEKWQLAFDTQARAFFVCARTAAKFMTRGGRIVALSYSTGGRTGGWQPWVGMGSAKAALESISRYFAVALGRHGITVNTVSPGLSDGSTIVGQTPQEVQDILKEWAESGWTPMLRRCMPEDIADVCALLCSDEARFMTGQALTVDGGSSLMNPEFPLAIQVPLARIAA
ncbi:MAG TPA: SDR family oxidoreductase [Candidatus Eremiobacteraceae bacterium]|nr:SDR family oxidoreductase [Candidatus Eremiobacteraceae bacterium]